MNHKKFELLCSADIDGCLTANEKKWLDNHLPQCIECTHYLEELKSITKIFSEFKPVEVPIDAANELRLKIRQLTANNQVPSTYLYWKYAFTGVASVTAISLVYFLYNYSPIEKNAGETMKQSTVSTPDTNIPLVSEQLRRGELVHPVPGVKEKIFTSLTPPLVKEDKGGFEVTKAVTQLKQNLTTNQVVSSTEVAKTEEAIRTMVAKGVSVDDAKRVVDTAVKSNLRSDQIVEISQAVTNISPIESHPEQSEGTQTTPRAEKRHSESFGSHADPKLVSGEASQKEKSIRAAPRKTESVAEFKFKEVSPNPFTPNGDGWNEETKFYFDNPENKEVTIRIFDLSTTLIKEIEIIPGKDPSWDGKNQDGELVEGGIYIYQLKVGNEVVKGIISLAK